MYVNVEGLTPPSTPSGTGMSRVLQAATDSTPAVTTRDVCNAMVASMANVTANTTAKDYNCAIQSEGATQYPANVPSSTVPQMVAPQDKLWDVIIIGAGGSGIAAAATALKRGLTVLMLEGRDRIGGRVFTDRSWRLTAPSPDLQKPGVVYETGVIPVDTGASWIHGMINNSVTVLAERFRIPYIVTPYGSNSLFTPSGRLSTEASAAADKKFSDFFKKVKAYIATLSTDVSLQAAFDTTLAASLADKSVLNADVPMLRYQLVSVKEHEYAGDSSSMSAKEFDNSGDILGSDCVFPLGFDQVLTSWFDADVAPFRANFTLVTSMAVSAVDTSAYAAGNAPLTVQAQNTDTRAWLLYKGRSIIVTAPLGVLKAGTIAFTPALSDPVAASTSKLALGVMNKYVIEADFGDDADK
jgi:hypothetical protein